MPYRFRGQYVFGLEINEFPKEFLIIDLPGGLRLGHDRNLPVEQRVNADGYLAICGFCFDSDNPEASLSEIAARLPAGDISALIKATSSFVGRWVLIASIKGELFAFSDAGGTMPLVYRTGGVGCASSSRLLACCYDLAHDAVDAAFASLASRQNLHAGQNFPLTKTGYSGAKALLPNHYLDLQKSRQTRYYFGPDDFGRRRASDVADDVGRKLVHIVKAIAARHEVAYAATGGYDSRLIASAISRVDNLASRTDFFTFRYPGDAEGQHDDIILARRVANTIGGAHRVIDAESDHPGADISALCRQSEEFYATGFEGWTEKACVEVEADRIILMGWASEIARRFFRWPGSDRVSPQQLADCGGVGAVEAYRQEFADWLPGAEEARAKTGIPVLDLFYWENRVGRWCGPGLNILNTSANWMTIFSCRDLLNLMLSVRESERVVGNPRLYREVIRRLNPGIAQIPINPVPVAKAIRSKAMYAARWSVVMLRRWLGASRPPRAEAELSL